jgi:tRNA pseudouridine32 synthase/23S rRNA pseudouridine746 synthase
MADNFLEKHYAEYEAKRNALQQSNRLVKKQISRLHRFSSSIEGIALPTTFTDPFNYTPHPLCRLATDEVMRFIDSHPEWHEELQQGKMFGVLVVKNVVGKLGFLAAFSGLLNKQNDIPYFVPAVYDMLNPNGHFKTEEREISAINRRIADMERNIRPRPTGTPSNLEGEFSSCAHPTETSSNLEGEFRGCNHLTDIPSNLQEEAKIASLKQERKKRSIALQNWLFEQFVMLNARGERKNLIEIFQEQEHRMPPGGAGECAAPKLLQYAFLNKLKPIAMAEFWWGDSPKGEDRKHGEFYPACQQKCKPILKYMLQ